MRLLDSGESDPVVVHESGAGAPFLIVCDHAGRAVPRRLGDLGLPAEAFDRHIAWDIGAGDLSRRLGEGLGARVIAQRYSRLVVDCNRAPGRSDSMPALVDETVIPGNVDLDPAEAAARIAEVHAPYHAAIARELDARDARGAPTILLLVHSFTPRLAGRARPWHFGVLHHGASPFSRAMLDLLAATPDHVTGDNEPYAMDEVDYTAGRHALARGGDYLELEVRQDLLANAAGRRAVADLLMTLLPRALESIDAP